MLGTIVNVIAVLAGGTLGLLLKGRLPGRVADGVLRTVGLCVIVMGIAGALKGDTMLLVVSLAVGTLAGEAFNLDGLLARLGGRMERHFRKNEDESSTFAEGFVSATLLFCVGAMSIVGSLESGLIGDHRIIFAKSLMDGISAMILASSLGAGVLLSGAVVFLYQGSIVLLAGALQDVLSQALITQLSAAGSIMILGIGLNMTLGSKLKVANMLPGLVLAAGYYFLFLK